MLDILIKNALIIDGSGRKSYLGDIGIKDGVIEKTGEISQEAAEVINAEGLIASPGFIDVHGHSDMYLFVDPGCGAKLKQGITTELAGQCGISPAPVSAEYFAQYKAYYQQMGAMLPKECSDFHNFKQYSEYLLSLPLGINICCFIGQGSIRIASMGLTPESASDRQINIMKGYLEEAMENGALGMSTGLMYAPGSFTATEELIEICKAMAPFHGIYTSHIRNQGNRLIESVEEAIRIGIEAGVDVNISHHKAVGKENFGKVKTSLAKIKEASQKGICVTHDIYPYAASSTTLSATLPPSLIKMGTEKLLEELPKEEFQKLLFQKIFEPDEEWDNDIAACGWEGILIIAAPCTQDAVGLTISQYAQKQGMKPFDAYIKLLLQNRLTINDICFAMDDRDVEYLFSDSDCMIGTDSIYVPSMTMVHPRSIGTFPKILGEYVREKKLLTLEKAIFKLTGLPASVYALSHKGLIEEGMDADLVLFDAEKVAAQADYINPLRPNMGISYVLVNGKIAVIENKCTDAAAGKVIRGGKLQKNK
jgi:N-acyl-D-aspartate/D-glutamate deacylase